MAFRSRLEEKVADLLVDLDVKYEYETVKVDYTIAHIYKPDFILPNGVVLECKGYWDSKDRRKVKAVKEQNTIVDQAVTHCGEVIPENDTFLENLPAEIHRQHDINRVGFNCADVFL